MYTNIKHLHIKGNFQRKTLCRETAVLPAADAACANNNRGRDTADWRRRLAAEEDARCESNSKPVEPECPANVTAVIKAWPSQEGKYKI